LVALNYTQVWANLGSELLDALTYYADPPQFPNAIQLWVLNILSVLFDTLILGVAVGVFAYHHRRCATGTYLAFGFCLRYLPVLVLLPLFSWKRSLSTVIEEIAARLDYEACILAILQFVGVMIASLLGMTFGKRANYLNEKDEILGYVAGISKKLWAVLIIAMNPMFHLATKASLVTVYTTADRATRPGYWDFWGTQEYEYETGFSGLFAAALSLLVVWLLVGGIAVLGIAAIGNKDTPLRRLRIVGVFVVVPILVVVVPLIRNRAFFF
jgi:hypothetical protein